MCLAILSGHNGHSEGVLSCDVHISGNYLVSSSFDHSIKIWKLDNIQHWINESYQVPKNHENVKSRFDSSKKKCHQTW